MNKILVAVIFLTLTVLGFSQDDDVMFVLQQPYNGTLTIEQPQSVTQEIKDHTDLNKKLLGIKGFRVQIGLFSGRNARQKAYSLKSDFLTKYPDNKEIYVSYSVPYFNVRVGNYFTKSAAFKALSELKKDYPGAFIIEDLITVEDEE